MYVYIYIYFPHVYSQRHFVHYAFSHGTSFGFYSLPNNDKRIVHRIFSGPLCSDMCELCDCDCLIQYKGIELHTYIINTSILK